MSTGGDTAGSTNSVDQLLRDSNSPNLAVQQHELNRLQRSAWIVHRNFYDLDQLGDNISQNGQIASPDDLDERTVRTEVFKRVHNYLASLYSFNEQARTIIDEKYTGRDVTKADFLPNPDSTSSASKPDYIKKLVFLWGLRNQFIHEKYRCLTLDQETAHDGTEYFKLGFRETLYSPTPKGGLEEAGDYLRYSDSRERSHPLCYIGNFHQNQFNNFESDLNDWCRRTLQS
jgi:hypothetical protein